VKSIIESKLTKEEKIKAIEEHFEKIMQILGLNLTQDSLADTPGRVAKMYVDELFTGLNPDQFPKITYFDFEKNSGAQESITIKNIRIQSICEHHFLPFIGQATIRYIPNKKILGLSKINRVVDYFCRRPQLQERLTRQIAESLSLLLETDEVFVTIQAKHLCVNMRGILDQNSETITTCNLGKTIE